jgi:hypothetical protein
MAAQAQNVTSVAQADAALVQVAKDRAAVHEEFAASERECSTKFFVNNCLDKAKENAAWRWPRSARRSRGEHFKRADSVAKRDADLAERARKDAEEAALRAAQPPKPAEEKAAAGADRPRVADREAAHEAKMQRIEQQDAAEAGKRAANVEAFERKRPSPSAARLKSRARKRKAEKPRAPRRSGQGRSQPPSRQPSNHTARRIFSTV